MMAYLLDANVFIKAKNDEYGFELCPGFWAWLDQSNAAGIVFSIDAVRDELLGRGDELTDWARAKGADFFLRPDEDVVSNLQRLSAWARGADYTDGAKAEFLGSGADSYLLAHAMAHGHTVVTLEQVDQRKSRIKIPEAAIPHNVKCLRPYEMLRIERARFVLEEAA